MRGDPGAHSKLAGPRDPSVEKDNRLQEINGRAHSPPAAPKPATPLHDDNRRTIPVAKAIVSPDLKGPAPDGALDKDHAAPPGPARGLKESFPNGALDKDNAAPPGLARRLKESAPGGVLDKDHAAPPGPACLPEDLAEDGILDEEDATPPDPTWLEESHAQAAAAADRSTAAESPTGVAVLNNDAIRSRSPAETAKTGTPAAAPSSRPKPAADSHRGAEGGGKRIAFVRLVLRLAVAAAVVSGLVTGGEWLFSGPVHPQALYLPEGCSSFVSLRWGEIVRAGATESKVPLPGIGVAERCRVFLKNAHIPPDQVERVKMGVSPDGGTILVYCLAQPVKHDQVMLQPALRGWRKSKEGKEAKETVRGIPVYVLDETAIAFPDAKTIVNGEADLIRNTLQRRRTNLVAPLKELFPSLDFSQMVLSIQAGVPRSLSDTVLRDRADAAKSVLATMDEYQYGDTLRFNRTFHFPSANGAEEFRQALRGALDDEVKQAKIPEFVARFLSSVQVTATDKQVRMEATLPKKQLTDKGLETIRRIF